MSNFNTTSNQNNNIYPTPCVYNCGVQIFWNTETSEYWEVFTKKKHICPNRFNKPVTANTSNNVAGTAATTSTKSTYYSKKPWNTQPKPKMSNSFELLTGPIDVIQKKYEILSDIVIVEHGGKVHGSQSHNVTNNSMQLIVYYEVPLGQRDEVKQKFDNMIRNLITLQRN
jgi:hypothetical protein